MAQHFVKLDLDFFQNNADYERAYKIFADDVELQDIFENDLNAFVLDCRFLDDIERPLLIMNLGQDVVMDVPRGLHIQDVYYTKQVLLLEKFAKAHTEFKPLYYIFCVKPYITKFYLKQHDSKMCVKVIRYSTKTEMPLREASLTVSLELGRKFIRQVGRKFRFLYDEVVEI